MFYRKTVLDNGITVISEPMESVRSITLGIWFAVGSRDESPVEAGMSHFMEHMMFKGTPTRTARDISEQFDVMGAEFNAGTSKEYTVYYARFLDQHLSDVFDLLSDMVVNATLAQEDCVKEREVVIEEIARAEDHPEDQVGELFESSLWPDHPIGLPIIGGRETVGSFGHDEAVAFRHRHFLTGNVVVAAAGNVDHDALVDLATRLLAGLPEGTRTPRVHSVSEGQTKRAVLTKDTEQAHILYGMVTMDAHDEDRFALSLISDILGGGMSSRLFQQIREQRGLAYAVQSWVNLFQDTGQFAVYVGTRTDNTRQVIELIREEFATVAREGVTEAELARAKESRAGRLVLRLESTSPRMFRLGQAEVVGNEVYSTDEILDRYHAVTMDDVKRVARTLLTSQPTLAIVSPLSAEDLSDLGA